MKKQGPVHEVCLADLEPGDFNNYMYDSFTISGDEMKCDSWKWLVPAVCKYLRKQGMPVLKESEVWGNANTKRDGKNTPSAIGPVKELLQHGGEQQEE